MSGLVPPSAHQHIKSSRRHQAASIRMLSATIGHLASCTCHRNLPPHTMPVADNNWPHSCRSSDVYLLSCLSLTTHFHLLNRCSGGGGPGFIPGLSMVGSESDFTCQVKNPERRDTLHFQVLDVWNEIGAPASADQVLRMLGSHTWSINDRRHCLSHILC